MSAPAEGVRIPGRRGSRAEKDALAKALSDFRENERSRLPGMGPPFAPENPPREPFGDILPSERTRFARLLMPDMPLSEPYTAERPPKLNDKVFIWWGEARGIVGTITSANGKSCFVAPEDPDNKTYAGMFQTISLRRIVKQPPKFASEEEAEAWLTLCSTQEYEVGAMVRLSEERDRDKAIQHVKVLAYDEQGPKVDSPPHYVVAILDADGIPIEVKSIAYYFVHGRAIPN